MDVNSIPLITAFVGTVIAAVWDLKTTEVPDQLPAAMIAIALLFYGYQSFAIGDYSPIANSLLIGGVFSVFGLFMYYTGQWGGADSFILAAIGFLLPSAPLGFAQTIFIFPLSYVMNLFIVGAAYMIGYAFVFSFKEKHIQQGFLNDMKGSGKLLFGVPILFALSVILSYFVTSSYGLVDFTRIILMSLSLSIGAFVLFVIWKFSKSVEMYGFKKKIPISKLRVGDMLLSEKKLLGITEKEIKELKRHGKKYVNIKLGVPFAVAFPLALLVTLYYGDLILAFVNVI